MRRSTANAWRDVPRARLRPSFSLLQSARLRPRLGRRRLAVEEEEGTYAWATFSLDGRAAACRRPSIGGLLGRRRHASADELVPFAPWPQSGRQELNIRSQPIKHV